MENQIYMSVFTIMNHQHNLTNVSHYIMTYVFPAIVFLAITGNTLLVLTILSDHLRKKSTGILLASSNVASILFTIASLCIVYYPWIYSTEGFGESCNILVFGYHALATWSVYLLSCACVERYIAICHPLSKYVTSQNSLKQSLKIIIGTFMASISLNCPMFWFSGLAVVQEMPEFGNLTFCHYFKDNWYMCFHEYIDLTFYCILPFFIISFCNMAIVRKTYFNKSILDKFATSSGGKSADGVRHSSKEFTEKTDKFELSDEEWKEQDEEGKFQKFEHLNTDNKSVLRCVNTPKRQIKNDMFIPDLIISGMRNSDTNRNSQRSQTENSGWCLNLKKTRKREKERKNKGCGWFGKTKFDIEPMANNRISHTSRETRQKPSSTIKTCNKMKFLYEAGTKMETDNQKIKNRKREPRSLMQKRSQAFKLTTILLPVSFLHLVFSLVVVVSIILEVLVTDRPCDKLLLLTVSYNAAQLQAGYHFYVNVAVSHVFRRVFKKMILRKTCSCVIFRN